MHVAIVTAFPPSMLSLNEYGFHLVKAFSALDEVTKISVIADKLPSTSIETIDLGPKVEILRQWQFNRASNMWKIPKLLRTLQPDLAIYNLHMTSFADKEIPAALNLLMPALSRMAGVKTGAIAHNLFLGVDFENTLLKGQRFRQAVVKTGGSIITRSLMQASYVTVTLRSYADTLAIKYPKADVTLVPHGAFETVSGDIPEISKRPKRIATMGKFGTYKRVDTLLSAFKLMRNKPELRDYKLVIGGTDHPNAKGYLADCENAYSDVPGIYFHGYVAEEEVPDFFENARLCVFDYTSTTGSSGVLHQAADHGAVPVFPNIGDFKDVANEEGIAGAHFEPQDAEGLANAMVDLLQDENKMQRLAEQNKSANTQMPMTAVAEWHLNKLQQIHKTL